jgi:hypothetical protein
LSASSVLFDEGSSLHDFWDYLSSTAAVTDDGYALACVTYGMVPPRSMEHVALKYLHTRKLDVSRERDPSNGGDENVCRPNVFDLGARVPEVHIPAISGRVPLRSEAFDLEVHVLSQIKFVNGSLHVCQKSARRIMDFHVIHTIKDLWAFAQLLGPVWIEVERERIQNGWHVAANAWVYQ